MYHQFSSQGNESLNMQMADVAPKTTNFSRTESLQFRVCYVVAIHNLGYSESHERLFERLTGCGANCVLREFTMRRDAEKWNKKARDITIESKRRRKHTFDTKLRDQLYRENTVDPKVGTYQSGIGAATNDVKQKKVSKKRKKYNQTPCNCGATKVHYRRSSKHCLKCVRKPVVEFEQETQDS